MGYHGNICCYMDLSADQGLQREQDKSKNNIALMLHMYCTWIWVCNENQGPRFVVAHGGEGSHINLLLKGNLADLEPC